MCSLESMWNYQIQLSKAQAVPIIGPVIVSPCKAVVSLAQIISGLAFSIFFSIPTLLTSSDYCATKTYRSMGHAGMGLLGFGYSITNILTLGFAAYRLENDRDGAMII